MRHVYRRAAFVMMIAGLLMFASPAVAAAPTYKGKVKAGGAITFQVSGGTVRHLTASVSVFCESAAPPRSKIDIYYVTPKKAARIGRDGSFTATVNLTKQRLFANGKQVDTLYNVKATVKGKIRGRNAGGSAHVVYGKNWFAYNPGTGYYQLAVVSCSAKTSWTAKRK
jgi:hypothetical protein